MSRFANTQQFFIRDKQTAAEPNNARTNDPIAIRQFSGSFRDGAAFFIFLFEERRLDTKNDERDSERERGQIRRQVRGERRRDRYARRWGGHTRSNAHGRNQQRGCASFIHGVAARGGVIVYVCLSSISYKQNAQNCPRWFLQNNKQSLVSQVWTRNDNLTYKFKFYE